MHVRAASALMISCPDNNFAVQTAERLHSVVRAVLNHDSCWLCGAGGAYAEATHICPAKARLWGAAAGGRTCEFCGSSCSTQQQCWYRTSKDRFEPGTVCYLCHVPDHLQNCRGDPSAHRVGSVRDIVVTLGRNVHLQRLLVAWLSGGALAEFVHMPPAIPEGCLGPYLDDASLRSFHRWCFRAKAVDSRKSLNVLFAVAFVSCAAVQFSRTPPWAALWPAVAVPTAARAAPNVLLLLKAPLCDAGCVFCARKDCPLLMGWNAPLAKCYGLASLLPSPKGAPARCTR